VPGRAEIDVSSRSLPLFGAANTQGFNTKLL
jgi:hypothetical protein